MPVEGGEVAGHGREGPESIDASGVGPIQPAQGVMLSSSQITHHGAIALILQAIEDPNDAKAARAALADAETNGLTPWENVRADLGL